MTRLAVVAPTLLLLTAATTAAGQETRPTTPPPIEAVNAHDDARAILARYAQAWRGQAEMPLAETVVVGFSVRGPGGGEFHITLDPDGPAALAEGAAAAPSVVFETDIETLRRIDRGEWNALTAMGQARASDPIPLIPRFPEGFRWTPEARAFFLPLAFHFWNRGWPEVVQFGDGRTRRVHGGNATVLYYDRGLRTAWYQIEPGMHVNADPRDQTNPFPTIVVMTRGALQGRLGGHERELREGEMIFIPAGMTHEVWANENQYGEFLVLMFGEDA